MRTVLKCIYFYATTCVYNWALNIFWIYCCTTTCVDNWAFQPLLLLSSTSAMSAQVQPLSCPVWVIVIIRRIHWLIFFTESSLFSSFTQFDDEHAQPCSNHARGFPYNNCHYCHQDLTGCCQRLIWRGASKPPGSSGSGEGWVCRSVHPFPEHCCDFNIIISVTKCPRESWTWWYYTTKMLHSALSRDGWYGMGW